MTSVQIDFTRLINIMMRTTSDQDGEALNAMRMANAMLTRVGKNWEEVLSGKVVVINVGAAPPDHSHLVPPSKRRRPGSGATPGKSEIETMLETLLDRVSKRSSFRSFIESVAAFHEENGFVTPSQEEAIRKAYDRERQ